MGTLVKIDFSNTVSLNMDDQVSLRDIYNKLVEKAGLSSNTDFSDWAKDRLQYYKENQQDGFYRQKTEKSGRGRPSIDYVVSIQVAMEILANGHGVVGHEMRQFMSACVRKVVENNIQLPFDMHDPESILLWSAEAVRKERTLRLVAEEKVAANEAVWEKVNTQGTWIGTSVFLKSKKTKVNNLAVTAHTQHAKAICREKGIELQQAEMRDGNYYYIFPKAVHELALQQRVQITKPN